MSDTKELLRVLSKAREWILEWKAMNSASAAEIIAEIDHISAANITDDPLIIDYIPSDNAGKIIETHLWIAVNTNGLESVLSALAGPTTRAVTTRAREHALEIGVVSACTVKLVEFQRGHEIEIHQPPSPPLGIASGGT